MNKVLTKNQKEAVEHGEGPLLIIAGAGTGKTTVITERIKHLILKKNIKPNEILALTFTEKASNEMQERIDRTLPYGYTQMWISTFHSFCEMILKDEAINIGLNQNFKLLNETQSIVLFKKNIFKLNLSYFRPLGNPNKFIEALIQHFSRLKDEDITPEEYLSFAKKMEEGEEKEKILELANVYGQYESLKINEGAMDFSDLISNTLLLFRKRSGVLNKYRDLFKFILIDEFQDTNYAQNELAILLSGNQKNITVVADDDQAIYRWRGAALSNVIQFKKNFPGTKIVTLIDNFRSTQEILDRSYDLIQNNNPDRLEVLEKIDKKLKSVKKKKGKRIEFINTIRVEEETEKIAKKIKELVEKEGYKYNEIAILIRANNHSQAITSSLQRFNIPYQFLGPGQLFQQEEIKDLIAYLKVLTNLHDSISLFRILNMDIFGISPKELNYTLSFAKRKNMSLYEAINIAQETYLQEDTKKKFQEIYQMIEKHLGKIKNESAGQIIYDFLVESGLYTKLLNAKTQTEEKISQNMAKFFDKIKNYESLNINNGVHAVIDWLEIMMEMGDSPLVTEVDWKDFNAVNILTIHSSKGLEFPIVFIANLVVDRFPTRERKEKIPIPIELIKETLPQGDYHLEEERRLFYVAMTRAMDRLIFTAANFYGEGKKERRISPFVYEAEPELLKRQENKEKEIKQLSLIDLTSGYNSQQELKKELPPSPFKINFISYSQLQTFEVCPLHYKAKFILGLPTEPSAALSFGITVHKILRDLYEIYKDKTPDLDEVIKLLNGNWVSEGYEDKIQEKKYFEKAEELLKRFLNNSFNQNTNTVATELPFSFYINRENSSPLKVSGKIDRIDLTENGIEIIDYKTGGKSSSKSAYDFQLGLYALAAMKVDNPILRKNIEDLTLKLHFVESGEIIPTKITVQEIKAVEAKILEKVKIIEGSNFECSKGPLCIKCEFKMLCNTS